MSSDGTEKKKGRKGKKVRDSNLVDISTLSPFLPVGKRNSARKKINRIISTIIRVRPTGATH